MIFSRTENSQYRQQSRLFSQNIQCVERDVEEFCSVRRLDVAVFNLGCCTNAFVRLFATHDFSSVPAE